MRGRSRSVVCKCARYSRRPECTRATGCQGQADWARYHFPHSRIMLRGTHQRGLEAEWRRGGLSRGAPMRPLVPAGPGSSHRSRLWAPEQVAGARSTLDWPIGDTTRQRSSTPNKHRGSTTQRPSSFHQCTLSNPQEITCNHVVVIATPSPTQKGPDANSKTAPTKTYAPAWCRS